MTHGSGLEIEEEGEWLVNEVLIVFSRCFATLNELECRTGVSVQHSDILLCKCYYESQGCKRSLILINGRLQERQCNAKRERI